MDINYKDSIVAFRKHNGYWEMNSKCCICCGEPIKNGNAILTINNYKYFGNVLIHEECFDSNDDKEYLCELIEEKYNNYKKLDDIFGSRTR